MTGARWHGGGRPPWWPEGESWPPHDPRRDWRRHRVRFMRRAALAAFALFALSFVGAVTVVSWAMRGTRGAWPAPSAWIVPLTLVALWVIGLAFVVRRLGSPLGDLVHAAHQIADGSFDVRVSPHGPPALRAVGRAFNDMAGRLAMQERQRRELMADIAHELRTPLSVVQGRLEGVIDGVYPADVSQLEPLLDETRILTRLVEDLRTLANAESGVLTIEREPVDVGMLIQDAAAAVRDESAAKGISIVIRDPSALPTANVDPLRIRQVLVNLLANAVRHGRTGTRVTVDARLADGQLIVDVSDDGPGIAAEELPKLFDRFYKGRGSTGSGLGLTIARSLARAHGGDIRAVSTPGAGTTITFHVQA